MQFPGVGYTAPVRWWLPVLALGLVAADAPVERGLVPTTAADVPLEAPRRSWAVVVGVSDYVHAEEGIPRLTYAHQDAIAFAEQLRSPSFGGGIPPEQLLLLTDHNATIGSVRQGLFEFLAQAGRDDLVIVYFAGHGLPDPLRPQDTYLLLHDTHPEHLVTTGLSMDEVRRAFDRVAAERVVLFADACHSAAIALPGVATRAVEDNRVHTFLTELARSGRNRVVVTSSDTDEVSFEGARWGHGVFTWALLEALREGDADRDGVVRLGEAIDHLRDRVERETQFRQHPVVSGEYDARLPLAVKRSASPTEGSGEAPMRFQVSFAPESQDPPESPESMSLSQAAERLRGEGGASRLPSLAFVDLTPVFTSAKDASALGFHLRSSLEAQGLEVEAVGSAPWEDRARERAVARAARSGHGWVFRGALGELGSQRSLHLELVQVGAEPPAVLKAYELAPDLDTLVSQVDSMLVALLTDAVGVTTEERESAGSLIVQTIRTMSGQLMGCYELALKGDLSLAGRVELRWRVEDGLARDVKVVSNDTGDEAFGACLQHTISRWLFPADADGDVEYPFVFRPL